jgi:hypothetical protein
MNNERYNQIIEDVYKNYLIEDGRILPNMSKEKMTELGYRLTQEEFIDKCKTDTKFSEKWGLKIEERELSLIERYDIHPRYLTEDKLDLLFEFATDENLDKLGVPGKLITLAYDNETIKNYA